MSNRNLAVMIFAMALLVDPSLAQQRTNSSPCVVEYENHNQTDYSRLIVQNVKGVITGPQEGTIPKACVGIFTEIFTEKDHKLVASAETDSNGYFALQIVSPGLYRLVVKAGLLCAANVPLLVVVKSQKKNKVLHVHMKPRGLDSCSYGETAQAVQSDKSPAGTR